jgi:hypothetical protein
VETINKEELLEWLDNEIEKCESDIKDYENFIVQANIKSYNGWYLTQEYRLQAKIEAYEDVKTLISE